jgi:hypothetical protein
MVLSAAEPYREGAERLASQCHAASIPAALLSLDLLTANAFGPQDIVLFLTNDDAVGAHARSLLTAGIGVINGSFLVTTRLKSATQLEAARVGISVPALRRIASRASTPAIATDLGFPLLLKREQHCFDVVHVANLGVLESVLASLVPAIDAAGVWYVEQMLDSREYRLEKYYHVGGEVFGRTTPIVREDISLALRMLGVALSLEVFSADIMLGSGDYYCIDVNPASTLFHSVGARTSFVRFVAGTSGGFRQPHSS